MSCSLEPQDACLPITAVNTINFNGKQLVLSGQGQYILLIDENNGHTHCRYRVFKRNAVHGIHLVHSGGGAESPEATFLARGGQSLRLVKLYAQQRSHSSGNISLVASSAEYLSPDWILDASFSNHADGDGTTPIDIRGCLITAHNVVFGLRIKHGSCSESETAIELYELNSKLRPVLYSADISWASPTHVLIAAGTVFGEIIVWSCYLSAPGVFADPFIYIHHFFTGHAGSIFGVDISPVIELDGDDGKSTKRFLASCSDDRTVQIWDISSCSLSAEDNNAIDPVENKEETKTRTTGFRAFEANDTELDQESCIAKQWGHISRIWGVNFLDYIVSDGIIFFNLISRSEDSTCQLWNLKANLTGDESHLMKGGGTLESIASYSLHTGKNLWAMSVTKDTNSFKIHTGGADGNVFSFTVETQDYFVNEDDRISTYSPEDICRRIFHDGSETGTSTWTPTSPQSKNEGKVNGYAFISEDSFLTITTTGNVLLSRITNESMRCTCKPSISFELIDTLKNIGSYCVVAGFPERGIGAIGTSSGTIWWYTHRTGKIESLTETDQGVLDLFMLPAPAHYKNIGSDSASEPVALLRNSVEKSSADLFIIATEPTPKVLVRERLLLADSFAISSAYMIESTSLLVLGSRKGGIALFDTACTDTIEASLCVYNIHGQDAVTSISCLHSSATISDSSDIHLTTTGRDGSYCIHLLDSVGSDAIKLQTVHRGNPPFGRNVEGALLDNDKGDMLLYGFTGPFFSLWNETKQVEQMRIKCGGAHRKWTFRSTPNPMFLWTKAAVLSAFSQSSVNHRMVRRGGHGREIKTAATSTFLDHAGKNPQQILATGAEDTQIRFFVLDNTKGDQVSRSFRYVRTIRKHSAGLQHIQWSLDGRILFSSSGAEEFYVWRIRCVRGIEIGVLNEGAAPKTRERSDLRIMHFDVVKAETEDTACDAFLLAMAYSNSTVRVFYYESNSTSSGGTFALVMQGQYTTNCLTQIRFSTKGSRLHLITGATDGRIALWDISAAVSQNFTVENGSIKRINDQDFAVEPSAITWQYRQSIQQSSIKAMEIKAISETELFIISGGDDNGLSFSRLTYPRADSSSQIVHSFSTVSTPDAHASAINAVSIFRQVDNEREHEDKFEFLVASSGNDQRLKIWSITGNRQNQEEDSVKVTLQRDEYTAVADLSCIEKFNIGEKSVADGEGLVLCGVGMEMWAAGTGNEENTSIDHEER